MPLKAVFYNFYKPQTILDFGTMKIIKCLKNINKSKYPQESDPPMWYNE